EAAKVKVLGDKMLMENVLLRDRKLSGCDATTIAVGKMLQMPIVSGDKDLMYVGEQFGVKVVW
ncbi:MAG: PIN domain nuclease, partial [Nitrososphaeria archaeon]